MKHWDIVSARYRDVRWTERQKNRINVGDGSPICPTLLHRLCQLLDNLIIIKIKQIQRHETDREINKKGDVIKRTLCPNSKLDISTKSLDKKEKNEPPYTDVRVIHESGDGVTVLVLKTLHRKQQKGLVKKRVLKKRKGPRKFCWKYPECTSFYQNGLMKVDAPRPISPGDGIAKFWMTPCEPLSNQLEHFAGNWSTSSQPCGGICSSNEQTLLLVAKVLTIDHVTTFASPVSI